jgi:excisionase family DNA binding protein
MTLKEAAELLGVQPVTLRGQIANKRLKATKRGRDWYVSAAETARYRIQSLGQPGRRHKKEGRS